jgi:hypothetical protein
MSKKYFLVDGLLVPAIVGGSVESVGSTLTVSFDGSFANNPNTSKSSDILFTHLALGEGPVYRINPNGPQDIEIDGRYIDDLVNFNTNNTKQDIFAASYATGTLTQKSMPAFGRELVTNVRFNSPIILKSGLSSNPDITAPAPTSLLFYPTSPTDVLNPIDSIKIKFNVTDLKTSDVDGDDASQVIVAALIHPASEILDINNYIAGGGMIINSLVVGGMAAELEIKIPDSSKTNDGYRVSVLKISEDIAEEGYTSEVEAVGFDEIRKTSLSYPKTALAGYAVKSTDFRTDSIPTYTSLIKGLIVDVPSNYNQPVLENGEVDWRQVEVPSTGSNSYTTRGYRLQESGHASLLTEPNPLIYIGPWDGSYKKDWTENPVWIIKAILTDVFNIPEQAIDKYNFYSVAQYCDAVNTFTGRFEGVRGFADGSFRFKPNGYLTGTLETLLGLPEGVEIIERRFTCGLSVTDTTDGYTLLSAIASSFRGVISASGGRIRLIIDKPDVLPVALFNETNIEKGSFKLSGTREEDVVTGVEVSYINFNNHFKKETVTLDSQNPGLIDFEKRLNIDAVGCTRKSQALRLGKYLLDSNSLLKRKVQFTAFADASDLETGDIISVSQQLSNTSYGYGGVVHSNSESGNSTVFLEHYTSPAITESLFTANTYPIALKIFKQTTNDIDYYIVSNTSYAFNTSSFTYSGYDLLDVQVISRMNKVLKTFGSYTSFSADTAPSAGDLWALGEIDPSNVFTKKADKLFKVDDLAILTEGKVNITATEYESSLLAQVDNAAIATTSTNALNLNYVTPPPPVLSLKAVPTKTGEGIIAYNAVIGASIDSSNYSVPVSTVIKYGAITNIIDVFSQG